MIYNDGLLVDICQTLALIKNQRHLHTDEVVGQIQKVHEISGELDAFLQRLHRVQKRSRTSQYLRAFRVSRQEDRELSGILSRLDRAKIELMARIQIAHVGMTATIHEGFAAALPVAKRKSYDMNIDRGYSPRPSRDGAISRESSPTYRDKKGRIASFDRATIICGDVGCSASAPSSSRGEFRDCKAWDDSVQVHGDMDTVSFRELLARRENKAALTREMEAYQGRQGRQEEMRMQIPGGYG